MTREEVIEILEGFVIGAKPCSQREIVDACASAYRMLKEQPSLPINLDEAAEEIAKSEIPVEAGEALDLNGDCYETHDINWPERCGFIRGFKAGAEWLAGQGETRDDITVTGDFDGKAHIFPIPSSKFNPGDKVVVQIRKK